MMRILVGIGVFCLGLAALGLWAALVTAPMITARLDAAAQGVIARAVHGMQVAVSGRDIDLRGLADGRGEKAALMADLRALPGVRAVRGGDVTLLAAAQPFVIAVRKDAAGVTISGNVPSEGARGDLAQVFGDGAAGLVLAAGAPANWQGLLQKGQAALAPLQDGLARIEGANLILSGNAAGPDTLAEVGAVLADVPVINGVRLLDDGLPVKYVLNYKAAGGSTLRGKLPKGITGDQVAAALGLTDLTATVTTAGLGDMGDIAPFAAWAGVLAQIEWMNVSVDAAKQTILAKLVAGADAAQIKAALDVGGFAVKVIETKVARAVAPVAAVEPVADAGVDLASRVAAAEPLAVAEPAAGTEPVAETEKVAVAEPAVQIASVIAAPPAQGAAPELEPALNLATQMGANAHEGVDSASIIAPIDVGLSAGHVQGLDLANTPAVQAMAGGDLAAQLDPADQTAPSVQDCQRDTNALLARSTLIFTPNTDELVSGAGIAQLAQLAARCAAGNLRAQIGGHSDPSGQADDNLILSQKRAERLRDALIANGVPAEQLTARGFGSSQPISENQTTEGRAKRTTLVWATP